MSRQAFSGSGGPGRERDMHLRAEGLCKYFGPRPVFRDVTFSVCSGQVILVSGANGSGKTTLLKILAGVLRPSSGRVDLSVSRGEIGYLGHETLVYPHLSVRDNLSFWLRLYRVPVAPGEPEGLLKRLGLGRVLYEPAATLSRGMAQKLSLARMLAARPRVLLMDEPATGLDPAAQNSLRQEILRAREAGKIVFWVSHAPEADGGLADGFLILEGGRAEFRERAASPSQGDLKESR